MAKKNSRVVIEVTAPYDTSQTAPAEIDAMRRVFQHGVDEWLGFDIPDEGSEDYERWQSMLMDIEDIQNIGDVREYLESRGQNFVQFCMDGEYDLIAAGLSPMDVPTTIIESFGEDTAQDCNGHEWSPDWDKSVFQYGGIRYEIAGGAILKACVDPDIDPEELMEERIKVRLPEAKLPPKAEVEALLAQNEASSSSAKSSSPRDLADLAMRRNPLLTRQQAEQDIEDFGG